MTTYEQHNGLPVDALHLTMTGRDHGHDQIIDGKGRRVIVALSEAGKDTYVPRQNAEGEDFYELRQVLQITDYELVEPSDPRWDDLAKQAITATDGRRKIPSLPFPGTEDLPAGEGANESE